MPITEDEFRTINEDSPVIDLAADTTQGMIYRHLLENADKAFRQREIVDAVDVPQGSVGPTLKRLERRGLVEHRGRYWKIADAEHATASAGLLGAAAVDEIDGGFSDDAVDEWMETALDPIDGRHESDNKGA
ncbi:winged helix-turn-helix domain-containing protein [Natrialba sp. SSL1]|uniref:winged helix-turn-helix domain-containing protein n=1 Tax=Natrialba sp. SSL1 TaxID=1869245 RepID=UPI0008F85646|nr:winged helix-turn-helix domain-containing protein [Natrialba sp. SSL1]OIB56699.1 hypothetical protein BBD46_17095 [Natrialba sp. SSL1]